jgi:hypothetical protein
MGKDEETEIAVECSVLGVHFSKQPRMDSLSQRVNAPVANYWLANVKVRRYFEG